MNEQSIRPRDADERREDRVSFEQAAKAYVDQRLGPALDLRSLQTIRRHWSRQVLAADSREGAVVIKLFGSVPVARILGWVEIDRLMNQHGLPTPEIVWNDVSASTQKQFGVTSLVRRYSDGVAIERDKCASEGQALQLLQRLHGARGRRRKSGPVHQRAHSS